MKKISFSVNKSIVWSKKIKQQPKKFSSPKLVICRNKKSFITTLQTIKKTYVISIFVDNDFYSKNKSWFYQFDMCINICSHKIIKSISALKTPGKKLKKLKCR